jgi:hypothetical protein
MSATTSTRSAPPASAASASASVCVITSSSDIFLPGSAADEGILAASAARKGIIDLVFVRASPYLATPLA